MGGYEKSIDLSKIAAIYEKYQEDPESSYKICGMGIIYRDPEDEPELQKEPEPMAYVNYCENRELMNPRCQKLADLDALVARQDKEWYADRNPKTNEPTMTAQMFFTVYYAEKGDKFLHHFNGVLCIQWLLAFGKIYRKKT